MCKHTSFVVTTIEYHEAPSWAKDADHTETQMTDDLVPTLCHARMNEIRASYPSLIAELREHRKEHMELALSWKSDLSSPAWVRVSPGPPCDNTRNSYRLCIGFRNVGCKYRERDSMGLGCLNCGYYARTAFGDVDMATILAQFKKGLRRGCEESTGFNSIEFLNDGSFLNTDEFTQEIQAALFGLVARMPRIGRILIETKPEHVAEPRLLFLLNILRPDQLLEVGIGFESADTFVREVCINKGFGIPEFEKAVEVVSALEQEYRHRVALVAYLIVKPAFLTHRECVEDIVASLQYLRSLGEKHRIRIVPKLEPAAVANGTVLSMLHSNKESKFYYEPLSYWAVLEILAWVGCEMGNAFEIRVGAREDMDDVIKAPAVYRQDGETFHPFDFVLYESIQKFNQHQSFFRLFAVIVAVDKQFGGLALSDNGSSLTQWLKGNGFESCAIRKFLTANAEAIELEMSKPHTEEDIRAMAAVFAVLDIMEGYPSEGRGPEFKERIDRALLDDDRSGLECEIRECFESVTPEAILKISVNAMSVTGGYAEVFFDVTDLLRFEKVSIWSRFVVGTSA